MEEADLGASIDGVDSKSYWFPLLLGALILFTTVGCIFFFI